MAWAENADAVKKIVGAIVVIALAVFLLRDVLEAPERLDRQELELRQAAAERLDLKTRVNAIERAIQGLDQKLDEMLCLERAERASRDWRDCY